MVHIERCKKAVLTMEEAVPIHTDGENAGVSKTSVLFSVRDLQ